MEEKTKLTKREYLGIGYCHGYENENGDKKIVPCSKEDFENYTQKENGWKYIPVIPGWKHVMSFAGQPKVDTPDTLMKEGDYIEVEGEVIVYEKNAKGFINPVRYSDKVQSNFSAIPKKPLKDIKI